MQYLVNKRRLAKHNIAEVNQPWRIELHQPPTESIRTERDSCFSRQLLSLNPVKVCGHQNEILKEDESLLQKKAFKVELGFQYTCTHVLALMT